MSKLAENPLAIYRALRRFENYVKKWAQKNPNLFRRDDDVHRDGPTYKDLVHSVVGILVTQQVYDLKSADVRDTKIWLIAFYMAVRT